MIYRSKSEWSCWRSPSLIYRSEIRENVSSYRQNYTQPGVRRSRVRIFNFQVTDQTKSQLFNPQSEIILTQDVNLTSTVSVIYLPSSLRRNNGVRQWSWAQTEQMTEFGFLKCCFISLVVSQTNWCGSGGRSESVSPESVCVCVCFIVFI